MLSADRRYPHGLQFAHAYVSKCRRSGGAGGRPCRREPAACSPNRCCSGCSGSAGASPRTVRARRPLRAHGALPLQPSRLRLRRRLARGLRHLPHHVRAPVRRVLFPHRATTCAASGSISDAARARSAATARRGCSTTRPTAAAWRRWSISPGAATARCPTPSAIARRWSSAARASRRRGRRRRPRGRGLCGGGAQPAAEPRPTPTTSAPRARRRRKVLGGGALLLRAAAALCPAAAHYEPLAAQAVGASSATAGGISRGVRQSLENSPQAACSSASQ